MKLREEKEKHTKEKKEFETKVREMAAKDKVMETRLKELENNMKEEKGLEESTSKLRIEVEESTTLAKPSLRDLPIVLISAYQPSVVNSPQTVTFESFLANYNNLIHSWILYRLLLCPRRCGNWL